MHKLCLTGLSTIVPLINGEMIYVTRGRRKPYPCFIGWPMTLIYDKSKYNREIIFSGDFSPSTDIGNYRMMQVKYFTNLPCNNINTTTSNNFFSSEETGFILSALPPPVNCSPREPPCATLNAPLSPSELPLYTLDDVFLPVSPFILPETPISLPRTPPHFCTQTTLPTTILLDYQQMQPTTSQFCAVPSPEFTALSPMAITTDFNFIAAVNEDGACLSLPELAPSPQPCRLSEDVGGDDDFDQRAVSESPPVTVMC